MRIARFARLLGALLIVGATTTQAATPEQQAIIDRIKPVAEVCLEGDASCATAAPVASGGTRSGKEVYDATCTTCHATGVAGAPKFGNAGDWAPRISQGMETLVKHAIEGIRGMPPKGTCMNCSDDEIKAAVTFMADGSK